MTRLLEGGEIAQRLLAAVPNSVDNWDETQVWVSPEYILEVCRFLKDAPDLELDLLDAVSAVDYIEHFEVIYHLTSVRHNQRVVVKTRLFGREEPTVPSVVSVWRGADLQEREIWDLMGITFAGHSNLKRIMLWEGFPGHPHRKDHMGG